MRAQIRLADEQLVATLDDSRQLKHIDAVSLAELLWANHVTAGEVSIVDWHENSIEAPTSGQKIAICSRLRAYESEASSD